MEEVLSGIRTVFAFGGEKIEVARYKTLLIPARNSAKRKALLSSIGDGITRFLFFACCAISFWFGFQWIIEDRNKDVDDKIYTPAALIIVRIIIELSVYSDIEIECTYAYYIFSDFSLFDYCNRKYYKTYAILGNIFKCSWCWKNGF